MTLIKIAADPDQIRWHCQSAINSFDTLSEADAIEMAIADMRAILSYLDAVDRSVAVDGAEQFKALPSQAWVELSLAK